MTLPLVSVITPAYNRCGFIEETVQSVLGQDYPNIEYFVVDDGSDDGTFEILQQLDMEGKITLLWHEGHANKGQSASINLGLSRVSGDYIAILDSDDKFASDKLSRQVAFLEKNTNVGMVYSNGMAIDQNNREIYQLLPDDHKENSDPNLLLLDCYIALPGASLARRSVYENVGYFEESFRSAQDHDMALRIMETHQVAYLPFIGFYYRRHNDSISVTGQEIRWRTGFPILKRAAARYAYNPKTLRQRNAVLNFRLGQAFWRQSHYINAIPCFLKAAALDPYRALRVISRKESVN
ncbi:MAG: glycosyltransferase [Thermodesulfobacteriota bacterium]|nr:glycosyltransferase [Thermodesulfobacteriota bacterium]